MWCCSYKMSAKGIAYCVLLTTLIKSIWNSCNFMFHTFSTKGVITVSINAVVSDFYILSHLLLILLGSC